MKKLMFSLFAAILSFGAFAQSVSESTNLNLADRIMKNAPNREENAIDLVIRGVLRYEHPTTYLDSVFGYYTNAYPELDAYAAFVRKSTEEDVVNRLYAFHWALEKEHLGVLSHSVECIALECSMGYVTNKKIIESFYYLSRQFDDNDHFDYFVAEGKKNAGKKKFQNARREQHEMEDYATTFICKMQVEKQNFLAKVKKKASPSDYEMMERIVNDITPSFTKTDIPTVNF